MTIQTAHSFSRIERILAFMVAGVVGLSILAFLGIIFGTMAGAGTNDGFSSGIGFSSEIWPVVFTLPYYGLPAGFLAIVALMVLTGVRRSREARQSRR